MSSIQIALALVLVGGALCATSAWFVYNDEDDLINWSMMVALLCAMVTSGVTCIAGLAWIFIQVV